MGRSLSSCLQVLLYGHTYIAMIFFCLFTGVFCTDPFFSFFCWSSRPGRYYTIINSENSLDYKNNSIILVHNNRTAVVVLSFFYPSHTYFLIWTLLFLLLALSARSIQVLILLVARCIDY